MANRTTELLVRAIIEVDASITSLLPFISAAHLMVDTHCSALSEEAATEVETWLAAHFITIRDNRAASESVTGAAGASQSYQFRVGAGLETSMYGSMAMQLDSTGGLSAWNTKVIKGIAGKTSGFSWLGTESEV